ncbi:MAG: transcription termination/antitermination NusG family protein [Alcanivoracaceae bacterium]|nr:transcription termination/antitermination NusG family protein [Alcanivoracaceae bacterium]
MTSQWFVVNTKPRQEQVALDNLQRQGYHAYLPRTVMQKRRRDQWHSVSEPLFPGYVFVQLTLKQDNTAPIRSTLGARGLVRFGSHIPALDNSLIDWFRQQEKQQLEKPQNPADLFKPGAPVTILNGPFAGLQAVYEMAKSSDRAMLLISLLGRPTPLQCHWHDICPA